MRSSRVSLSDKVPTKHQKQQNMNISPMKSQHQSKKNRGTINLQQCDCTVARKHDGEQGGTKVQQKHPDKVDEGTSMIELVRGLLFEEATRNQMCMKDKAAYDRLVELCCLTDQGNH